MAPSLGGRKGGDAAGRADGRTGSPTGSCREPPGAAVCTHAVSDLPEAAHLESARQSHGEEIPCLGRIPGSHLCFWSIFFFFTATDPTLACV